ncbi:HA1F protein, partial [Menura novaehollandiae]|nr:HA1F protein [Menura novaehollandiae]
VLHSLHYLRVAVSEPGPGMPQYLSMGYLDGIPFDRYDSERGRVELLTLWVEARVELEHWDRVTQTCERNRHVNVADLETLQGRYIQSRDEWGEPGLEGICLHTLQKVSGCDLLSNRSVRGSKWQGYNGRDFISFQLGSRRFVAADGTAQVTKRRWDADESWIEWLTNYLGQTCLEELQKFIGCGQEALERKEPPDIHVSGKVEHRFLTLSCPVYRCYRSTIGISWMKGDEIRDQETQWGGIVPNSNGTFHTWARIEVLPEEWEQYRCRVEHPGMPEPGIFAWEPESVGNLILVVAVPIIAAIVVILLIRFGVWKLQS